MIDPSTIARIKDAANIVEVVSEFVSLRRRGVNYVGLCPFHNEKTPSFSVSPAKGLCKCFSCGKGGDAVGFIMEHEQFTYTEALRFLAKKYNIEIKERELTTEEQQAQSLRESLFVVNEFARDYFCDTLQNHPEGRSVGMAYLRERGFRDDIIAKFQLGYCTESHDAMGKQALQKGYRKEFLVKTGICYETEDGRLRDRFWGRVIFPVHTLSGKVVAFGGRVLSSATKGVKVKYVNSPESEIYHKSNELYGIYFAKQAMVKQDRCFLVEGYTDVISMHQSGVENVVASSGTALTGGQIRLIHRFTSNITVLYDGDSAGIKASLRGIDMLLEEGMNVKVCLLPDGDDPDSFARKHTSEEFQGFIRENEKDFIRFKTALLMEEAGRDPMKRAELIGNIVDSIAVIPEAIVRDVYIKDCGQQLNVEEKLLVSEVAKRREARAEKASKPTSAVATEAGLPAAAHDPAASSAKYESFIPRQGQEDAAFYVFERQLVQLIVRHGEKPMPLDGEGEQGDRPMSVAEWVWDDLAGDDLSFHNPLHQRLLEEAHGHAREDGFVAERYFLAHPDSEVSRLSAELAGDRYELSKYHFKVQKIPTEAERLGELVPRLILDYKNAVVKEELKHLLIALQGLDSARDGEQCDALMERYNGLREIQRELARLLGDRVVLG